MREFGRPVQAAELRAREGELVELLAYLGKKELWLKSPLGRPPTPPPGEDPIDSSQTASVMMSETRSRIDDTERRLDTLRALF